MKSVNMMYDNQIILLDEVIKILHLNHFTSVIKRDLNDNELTDYLRLKCELTKFVDELSEDLIQTTTLAYILQDIDNQEYDSNNNPQYFAMSRHILTNYKEIDRDKFAFETFEWLINGRYTFSRNRVQKILKVFVDRYYNIPNKEDLKINIDSVEKILKML